MKKQLLVLMLVSSLIFMGSFGFVDFGTVEVSGTYSPSRGIKVLYVGGTGGGNYTSIQTAIDAASAGDTVFVYNGTYTGKINITKSINLIGEKRDFTIIKGGQDDNVIIVNANNVNISRFTIIGVSQSSKDGILLNYVSNCQVINNNISSVKGWGITLKSSSNNTITNNLIFYVRGGIRLIPISNKNIIRNNHIILTFIYYENAIIIEHSNNNNIINNKITFEYTQYPAERIGIYLISSDYNLLKNNSFINKLGYSIRHGIKLFNSLYNNIINNIIGYTGWNNIEISKSSFNNITDNYIRDLRLKGTSNYNFIVNNNVSNINIYSSYNKIIKNQIRSIYMGYSINNVITENNFTNGGLYIYGNELLHYNSHNIPTNNKINNKPLYYSKNCSNITLNGKLLGQVILANCTNFNILNLQINNTEVGIHVTYSSNISIKNNMIFSNRMDGIKFQESFNNTIFNNTIYSNLGNGIQIIDSFNSSIIKNSIYSNGNVNIYDRWPEYDGYSKYHGISLISSSKIFIQNNTIYSNFDNGIFIDSSENNFAINNTIYLNEQNGIYLEYSSNINISSNIIMNNENNGIYLRYSLKNELFKNEIFLHNGSLSLVQLSSKNSVSYNNIVNDKYSIFIHNLSTNNKIYHNNIITNSNQSFDDVGLNFWNDTYPTGGNYWSNYTGVDKKSGSNQDQAGSDGIGDTPYPYIGGFSGAKDHYPLMKPVKIGNFTPTVPFPPQNLHTTVGDGFVNLSWDAPFYDGGSPIIHYSVYRSTTPGKKIFLNQTQNKLFYNDTSVQNNITYYYKLSAVNAIGESPLSDEISATPKKFIENITQTVPSQPRNLRATAGDGYVNLSWGTPASDGNASITNYKIYKGTHPGGESFLTTIGNLLIFNDTNVSNNVTYFYRISAKNAIGEGPLSNEIFVTPNPPKDLIFKDSDKDGIPDYWEQKFGLNSSNPYDAKLDSDNDNLTNYDEYLNQTDPRNMDSDKDNLSDGEEIKIYGTDPLNRDSDNDNLSDGEEINIHNTNATNPDTDGDGYNDGIEVDNNTDPLDNKNYPGLKTKKKTPESDDMGVYIILIAIVVMILIILMLLVIKRRRNNS